MDWKNASTPTVFIVPYPATLFHSKSFLLHQQHHGDDEGQGEGMKSLLSGVYSKDWVNDFVEPDESVIEEGRKTIDFLLKR